MRKAPLAFAALLALAAAAPALGAPIYMKIEGIDGEAVGAPQPGSIEIDSAQFVDVERRVSQQAPRGGTGIPVQMGNLNVTKRHDKTSPKLMEANVSGKPFKQVVITMRKAGGTQDYLVLKLENVLVSSFQGGRVNSSTESLSLNFTKLLVDYHPPVASHPAVQHPPATVVKH